jgi:periplasmic protein TonB
MLNENMFAGTVESSWTERARRSGTILSSFGLQALLTSILLILPLLRPTGLPTFRPLLTPISLGQPSDGPTVRPRGGPSIAPRRPVEFFFRRPSPLPAGRPVQSDDGAPLGPDSGPYLPVGGADPHGIQGLLPGGSLPILPSAPPPTVARPLLVSHISEGNLTRKVQPTYPALARSARIQGTVVLQAIISKQGTIENLTVVTGHPMLAPAAIEAVRQWRYRPYILNNEPVEVETQITVNFSLSGN